MSDLLPAEIEIVRAARGLIADPDKFTPGGAALCIERVFRHRARRYFGAALNPAAVAWDARGAIRKSAPTERESLALEAKLQAVCLARHGCTLVLLAAQGHAAVLSFFDSLLATAAKPGKVTGKPKCEARS